MIHVYGTLKMWQCFRLAVAGPVYSSTHKASNLHVIYMYSVYDPVWAGTCTFCDTCTCIYVGAS